MTWKCIRQNLAEVDAEVIAVPVVPGWKAGGAELAVRKKAGAKLKDALAKLKPAEPGSIRITDGYDTKASYIFQLYSPSWKEGSQKARTLLEQEYRLAMETCLRLGCSSIAFALIGAGSRGFPVSAAFDIAKTSIENFLADHPQLTVILTVYSQEALETSREILQEVQEYIDQHTVDQNRHLRSQTLSNRFEAEESIPLAQAAPEAFSIERQEAAYSQAPLAPQSSLEDLSSILEQTEDGFSAKLLHLIDQSGMSDAQCYKKAGIDRKLFSKIRSHPDYHPKKSTVFAFAIALGLDVSQTEELLESAGYAFSSSSKFDLIIRFCLERGIDDLMQVNEYLFSFDQHLLGL